MVKIKIKYYINGRNPICPNCGKSFGRKRQLRTHVVGFLAKTVNCQQRVIANNENEIIEELDPSEFINNGGKQRMRHKKGYLSETILNNLRPYIVQNDDGGNGANNAKNVEGNGDKNGGELGNGMEIELNQSVAEKLDGNENGRNDREKGEDGEESESGVTEPGDLNFNKMDSTMDYTMEEMIIVDGPNDALNNGNLFNNGFVLEGMEVNENKLEGKKNNEELMVGQNLDGRESKTIQKRSAVPTMAINLDNLRKKVEESSKLLELKLKGEERRENNQPGTSKKLRSLKNDLAKKSEALETEIEKDDDGIERNLDILKEKEERKNKIRMQATKVVERLEKWRKISEQKKAIKDVFFGPPTNQIVPRIVKKKEDGRNKLKKSLGTMAARKSKNVQNEAGTSGSSGEGTSSKIGPPPSKVKNEEKRNLNGKRAVIRQTFGGRRNAAMEENYALKKGWKNWSDLGRNYKKKIMN